MLAAIPTKQPHQWQQEPHWQDACYRHRQLPRSLCQWLFDRGSLTQKLVKRSAGQLRVEVLTQAVQRARLSEYQALGLNVQRWALIREVILYGNNTPWVYARTAIPLSTLKGPLNQLNYLGSRPLGEALFADPTMRRKSLQFAPIHSQHLSSKASQLRPLWGRRSLFFLKGKSLLVSEVFLKDLME